MNITCKECGLPVDVNHPHTKADHLVMEWAENYITLNNRKSTHSKWKKAFEEREELFNKSYRHLSLDILPK